jgi:putative ABC transport system permease protein
MHESVHPITFEQLRGEYFRNRRAMIYLLLSVTLMVGIITGIGIMGLTGFWVQRRAHQIGIYRALGATRGSILRYFMIENLLVVGCGACMGMVIAYTGSLWLMETLELPPMPPYWPLIAGLLLCLLGQIAVLRPALRASKVPPVTAIRAV